MSSEEILDTSYRHRDPTANTVTKGKRFANYIVDIIITAILNALVNPFQADYDMETGEMSGLGMSILVSTLLTVGYYFFMESATGQTLGKMVTGTKVVDENGNKPALGSIFVRCLCRLIPFEQFSFFGPKTIGWHDSLSKTYVVPKSFDLETAGVDEV